MALRCRPGDLAVVIVGVNAGAFVDVVERAPDHPVTHRPAWFCRSRSELDVTLVDQGTGRIVDSRRVPPGVEACFEDTDLQPIRPPGKGTSTRTDTHTEKELTT